MTERAIDYWGDCGDVVGWDPPIKLTCPRKDMSEITGRHLFKRDRDGATVGIHPNMITICEISCEKCEKRKKGNTMTS